MNDLKTSKGIQCSLLAKEVSLRQSNLTQFAQAIRDDAPNGYARVDRSYGPRSSYTPIHEIPPDERKRKRRHTISGNLYGERYPELHSQNSESFEKHSGQSSFENESLNSSRHLTDDNIIPETESIEDQASSPAVVYGHVEEDLTEQELSISDEEVTSRTHIHDAEIEPRNDVYENSDHYSEELNSKHDLIQYFLDNLETKYDVSPNRNRNALSDFEETIDDTSDHNENNTNDRVSDQEDPGGQQVDYDNDSDTDDENVLYVVNSYENQKGNSSQCKISKHAQNQWPTTVDENETRSRSSSRHSNKSSYSNQNCVPTETKKTNQNIKAIIQFCNENDDLHDAIEQKHDNYNSSNNDADFSKETQDLRRTILEDSDKYALNKAKLKSKDTKTKIDKYGRGYPHTNLDEHCHGQNYTSTSCYQRPSTSKVQKLQMNTKQADNLTRFPVLKACDASMSRSGLGLVVTYRTPPVSMNPESVLPRVVSIANSKRKHTGHPVYSATKKAPKEPSECEIPEEEYNEGPSLLSKLCGYIKGQMNSGSNSEISGQDGANKKAHRREPWPSQEAGRHRQDPHSTQEISKHRNEPCSSQEDNRSRKYPSSSQDATRHRNEPSAHEDANMHRKYASSGDANRGQKQAYTNQDGHPYAGDERIQRGKKTRGRPPKRSRSESEASGSPSILYPPNGLRNEEHNRRNGSWWPFRFPHFGSDHKKPAPSSEQEHEGNHSRQMNESRRALKSPSYAKFARRKVEHEDGRDRQQPCTSQQASNSSSNQALASPKVRKKRKKGGHDDKKNVKDANANKSTEDPNENDDDEDGCIIM